MTKPTDRKQRSTSSNDLHLNKDKERTLEQRKREAYSAMGKLGGLARAKQMAEKGFATANELKTQFKKANKNKTHDGGNSRKK